MVGKFKRRNRNRKGCRFPEIRGENGNCKLTQIPNGCRCRIRRHNANGAIRQRLLDMGFLPNAELEMVRCATLGDPLEMRMGDYYVTLRKREAELIEVGEA